MSQFKSLLLLFCAITFRLSLQTQLFLDFSGTTPQTLLAQASHWTLSDPSGTTYPITISECFDENMIFKSKDLPTGSMLKRTFSDLLDHKMLRFYVKVFYLGKYAKQTVNIKFDQISLETSEVTGFYRDPGVDTCDSLAFAGLILYTGIIPHSKSSVTVQFSTNLHGSNKEVIWGLRDFSFVTDTSDTPPESATITAQSDFSKTSLDFFPCSLKSEFLRADYYCIPCAEPCGSCYGPDSTDCFNYRPDSSEALLCPVSQTLLASGCVNCAVENCTLCDNNVNQCDTCLTTCAQCSDDKQCEECTIESNLVLYQGSCIESCPQGTYQDSNRKCHNCQPGCSECTDIGECSLCDRSLISENGYCICSQENIYYETESSDCTGTCLLGCKKCIFNDECLACNSGLTVQENGDCRCDNDGFYYQETSNSCTGQCFEYCNYCHDSTSCLECSGNRVPKDGKCKCESPRILIGTNCECPACMIENPDTLKCEYNDLVDIAYQSTVSPLFDAILQFLINPGIKWNLAPTITWTGDCNKSGGSQQFQEYLSGQTTDILLIPKIFLDFDIECDITANYIKQNGQSVSKQVHFQTFSSSEPQIQIPGGPLQMVNQNELNFIFVQVLSFTGTPISDAHITWVQTSGDQLDMTKLVSPQITPNQLTFPKCTLSKGKIYTFKVSVKTTTNGPVSSQEITIGVYSAKINAHISQIPTQHLHSDDLTLTTTQLYIIEDECNQSTLLSDLVDLSTAMYTWECLYTTVDLFTLTHPPPADDLLPLGAIDTPDFLSHPDPQNLFYHSSNSPTLTIPSSYFTDYQGFQFIFYVTVTLQRRFSSSSLTDFIILQPKFNVVQNQTSTTILSSLQPLFATSFSCSSENNCQAISDTFSTYLTASNFNPQYTYTWIVTFPLSSMGSYKTLFSVYKSYSLLDGLFSQIFLITNDKATNQTSSIFFTMPLNIFPQNGSLNVYPQEGEAFNTIFFLNTYCWIDFDLPLTFQFSSWSGGVRSLFMLRKFESFASTIMVHGPGDPFCLFNVLVTDNLGSSLQISQSVVVTGMPDSFTNVIDKSKEALEKSRSSKDLYERFRVITVIIENLAMWEPAAEHSQKSHLMSSQLKYSSITQIKEIFLTLNQKQEMKQIMLQSIGYSSEPIFNQEGNWQLYTNMLDFFYQANNSASILPQPEQEDFFKILDNLLYSMTETNTATQDPDQIFIYLNTFIRSTLQDAHPTDNYAQLRQFGGKLISAFTAQTTYCQILEITFDIYSQGANNRANFTLRPNQTISPSQCLDPINIIFVSFRPVPHTLIFLDLRDPITGKSLLDLFTFYLWTPVKYCPEDATCTDDPNGGIIVYGIFDLKDQVNKIFAKSKISQVTNFFVLLGFKFWKNVAFWTVLGFSLAFLSSLYLIYVKHSTYCALSFNKNISQESLFKKIRLFFLVIHPLVGIYIYNDPKITKTAKLAIYYQRLVIVMVFSTIFSSIEKGEGTIFKTYILLFNTLTVTPINALLSRWFQYALNMKGKNATIKSKLKFFMGILFYLLLLLGSFLVIFIIEAQQQASQNKAWAINFLISFGQDLTISPLISIISKTILFKLSQTNSFLQIKGSSKILSLIISDDFKSIFKAIFIKPIIIKTLEDCPSSRTTTQSPLSTDRKLLKFNTLDPGTPRPPYEFRSRRASESEINTVDLVTAENLVSNRFQTFFSEAKPESVKKFSLIKENFQKMQSSNIYSKTSNPKLGNAITSPREPEKLINLTSIVFTANEEDIFSFDENRQETYASSPKNWKTGKTLKESLYSPRHKTSTRFETVI